VILTRIFFAYALNEAPNGGVQPPGGFAVGLSVQDYSL
jgi:hypothetical protein